MIELEHLTKRYGDAAPVVRDVSLRVEDGEFLVLIGESGSGKTTTLNMINRLAEPTGGRVLIDNVDVRAGDAVALRREIGFVFQEIGLFPHMTVAENIAITPRLLAWPQSEIYADRCRHVGTP